MTSWRIIEGDCRAVMHSLMAESVDAVVCDPPYGLEFMGKEWDGANGFRRSLNIADVDRPNVFGRSSRTGPEYRAGVVFQEWCNAWATEALRVLKPGGHLVAFGGPRTYHRLACGIEDAGFEIRDKLSWLFGSGFPKSLDVSKAIETHAGVLTRSWATGAYGTSITDAAQATLLAEIVRRGEIQAEHDGAGTALKPGHEPICLARKPFRGNVAANVLAHGTGGLNVDGCRLPTVSAGPGTTPPTARGQSRTMEGADIVRSGYDGSAGRWPANVVMDEEAAAELDAQAGGASFNPAGAFGDDPGSDGYGGDWGKPGQRRVFGYGDSGGASRFYAVFHHEEESCPCRRASASDAEPCSCPRNAHDASAQSGAATAASPEGRPSSGDSAATTTTTESESGPQPGSAMPPTRARQSPAAPLGAPIRSANPANGAVPNRPIDTTTTTDAPSTYDGSAVHATSPSMSTSGDRGALGSLPIDSGVERFRYCAKASSAERGDGNTHPTVKPIDLMRWLCRLVTPKGGTILDPFTGSGTTGIAALREGLSFIGIEREAEYVAIARARIIGDSPLINSVGEAA